MQNAPKVVWSIPYVSVAFFPSLKHNFIAYRSSKVSSCPDYIFEIHQLWKSGFSRVYFNSCCSWSFEAEIIKISQSSHKMYNNDVVNFQESTTILNACTKKVWKLIVCTTYLCFFHLYVRMYLSIDWLIYLSIFTHILVYSFYLSINLSIYVFMHFNRFLSISLCSLVFFHMYVCMYLSIYLSSHVF